MADLIKCNCPDCGAKYRLPAEFRGRSARCKKCGTKFKVPENKTVDDSVLDWLTEAEAKEDQLPVDQPREISLSRDVKPSKNSASGNSQKKAIAGLKTTSGSSEAKA